MIHINKSAMSLEALKQMQAFKRLRPRQRMFVLTVVQQIIDGFDLDSAAISMATQAASYEPTTAESRRIFGYQMLREKKILDVLRIYSQFGKSARQVAIAELKSAMDAAPEGSLERRKLVAQYGKLVFKLSKKLKARKAHGNRKS
jgi:hypothetical protein